MIATILGTISGATAPFLSGPWTAAGLGSLVNVSQYSMTQLNNGRQITENGLFWSAVFGAVTGWAGYHLIKPSSPNLLTGYKGQYGYYGFSPGEAAKDYAFDFALFSLTQNLPRSFLLSLYMNSPDIVEELLPIKSSSYERENFSLSSFIVMSDYLYRR